MIGLSIILGLTFLQVNDDFTIIVCRIGELRPNVLFIVCT